MTRPTGAHSRKGARRRTVVPNLTRSQPVVGYTGINGSGKTLLAVSECIGDMQRGRTVASTVPISSPWGDSIPIKGPADLLSLEHCTVLLDEVSVLLSSRDTMSLPPEVEVLLQTLRHRDVTVKWTAPSWMRADVMLREVTWALVTCFGLAKIGGHWGRPRLVAAGLLDTASVAKDATPDKVLRRRIYVPTALAGWGAYDTHADTPRLRARRAGRYCTTCGGTVPVVKCSCLGG